MNMFLWVLQVLLALHTIIGAVWKFSNSEQTVPALAVIPPAIWMALSVFELICALGLLLPAFRKDLGKLIPMGALGIGAVMLLFCGLQLTSGQEHHGEIIYWLVVAAFCGFIAFGRTKLKPL